MKKRFVTIFSLVLTMALSDSFAQFNLDGQILQRSEYRNGFGSLIRDGQDPALFTAHRARLQAQYTLDNLTFYMSVQDIRVWGSTPQVKATDNFLSVHEAWAQLKIGDFWSVKLGRQELNYDNFRFLGNLDWALQARAHDFALAKYEKENMKFHFGGAYNQAAQSLTDQPFLVPNQYKIAQMARYENKWGKVSFSALFWNDGREWQNFDQNGVLLEKGVRYRSTLGIPTLRYNSGNSQISAFYYHQLGKDLTGKELNAYNFSIAYNHTIPLDKEAGKIWTLSLGTEHISGTSNLGGDGNRSYNPLYGTNHLFNGYMDLFFVGGTHENSVGLEDYFLRSRYAFNKKFFLQSDYHLFYAQNDVFRIGQPEVQLLNSYFGSELDLTLGWIVSDAFSIQAGYSQFFHTDTYAYLKNVSNAKDTQNWAYLMLVFRPTMKNKFIGILL
ncbi:alginate export family protein [Cecembia rubra]|uniref:Alginate export protein n=1 Tax=Cecembia rubra TaxID=1485585 RepID=A0A2P8EE52_9BACT|nr:alginate export family protein [Cecembia rubra]PSL07750.1 alginate export protein [Cecembia rubra]